MKKDSSTPQRVRIISGYWRSRLINIVDSPGLRPTTDRVRETVFNWLNPYLGQAKVIDLFAGTGILGLEACSRGASEVLFIEKNALVLQALQTNLEKLKPNPPNSIIQCMGIDALHWLKNQVQIDANIILIDPPFNEVQLLEEILVGLTKKINKARPPIIYVESSSKLDNETILRYLPGWVLEKQLTAGAVKANILKLAPTPEI
jgi:16S rRNA (guanine966-N2)-methyltransferase